ncbi:MAG: PhzF family phenazine biosynthesis protein [Vampirovibrio sp.]|nr:PhzF family phenazine biosynthesis protein [Vampirovibrio sp.]
MKFWQVDAFTNQPFQGNPAAIFILEEPISDEIMQNIAVEMNLSETAFILQRPDQNPLLRWFTPMVEIDLCGHATLASAHTYLTAICPEREDVTFDTKFVGPLKVSKAKNTRSPYTYTMDFPLRPGEPVSLSDIPAFVLDALTPQKPVEAYLSRDLMLVYDDEDIVRAMNPDFNALMDYKKYIIVTAKSLNPNYDFISRFFCADDGITEDPVTGSAHCTSAPYWATQLQENHLIAYQASSRGGQLTLDVGDERLAITGEAVTLLEGKLICAI